ncbi:MAG: hypothetical protein JXK07_14150 [Spirochaetes bacterium]|nr:hypothetical protein [Spirochaetota bacterium]MBN2770139.1 hypothetical protein [Spirochaetota bacterium]
MEIYVNLQKWIVRFISNNQLILDNTASLFASRASNVFDNTSECPLLTCTIIDSEKDFNTIRNKYSFSGPKTNVSPGIVLQFDLNSCNTVFTISDTAVIEIDSTDTSQRRVYIEPHIEKSPNDKTKRHKPAEESFVYPLMVEWLKKFDSCLIHCGAVMYNNRAIVFSGQPGSGKSTQVIRLLCKGFTFLADDLAILTREEEVKMLPFRQVANVTKPSTEVFPEIDFVNKSPLRGDNKYSVDITEYFPSVTNSPIMPGLFIHLFPDDKPIMKETDSNRIFDKIHTMAWSQSQPEDTANHFWLLTDWLINSIHWDVSQGFLRNNFDQFIQLAKEELDKL